MNAAQEKAFDERSADVGRALWPGRIQIGGEVYGCELVRTTLELMAEGGTGAILEVEAISVAIPKADLSTCPDPETVVKDLADNGLYLVKRVGGLMAGDTSWFLTCARKP